MESYCLLEFFMFSSNIGVLRGRNWDRNSSMNAA
jgi:hypothetical protein